MKLTAAIFHSIDAATDAQFTFTIQNEHGSAVRVLRGVRTFPGRPWSFLPYGTCATLTITGTSGTLTHSTTVTLVSQ